MRGFTLVEIIITIIILSVVVGALLPAYNNFSDTLRLRRAAQEVALTLREAQASAIAVKGYDDDANPATPLVFKPWGVFYPLTGSDVFYTLFVDLNNNQSYDAPNPDGPAPLGEKVKFLSLINYNVRFKNLCARLRTGTVADDICTLSRIDVLYQRPNPDTILKGDGIIYPDVEIILENTRGKTLMVVVWASGQVTVE